MDPAPRVNPNKLILGETKLIFWPTGRAVKKKLGPLVDQQNKNNTI